MCLELFTDDVIFAESPRWREGALWFSDIKSGNVYRAGIDGSIAPVLTHIEGNPCGLGWLPSGDLLVVSMQRHQVLRVRDGASEIYCDTSHISRYLLNDMVVDNNGNVFLSSLGFDYESGEPFRATPLIRVATDGSVYRATEALNVPNGMAISSDGRTLIVGQSARPEILAYDLADSGELSRRRIYARLPDDAVADGICLDVEGGVWVASPTTNAFLRVTPGQGVTHTIKTGERHAIACVLGGSDYRTLFCMTAASMGLSRPAEVLDGRIEMAIVDVPGTEN